MVILLIPGQLTWLLHMLDVKVFGQLKARFRKDFMKARIDSRTGRVAPGAWARIGIDAVYELLVQRT